MIPIVQHVITKAARLNRFLPRCLVRERDRESSTSFAPFPNFSITVQHQFLILLLYSAMEPREYKKGERERQNIRQRSRSPVASRPLTEAESNPREDRRDGRNSLRPSGDVPAENPDVVHSTTKSPKRSSEQLPGGHHRSRPRTHLSYLTKDERRKIWIVRKRWGVHPRYPDYDSAESSADEEELATRKRLLQEMLDKEKASDEAWAMEKERRHNIGPEARAVEDGDELLREIEADDNTLVVLQQSSSNRARCRAGEYIHVEMEGANGQYIADQFRICVDKGRAYDGKHYYHTICFERMIALEKLFPSKILMKGGPWNWGLMVRRWFENRGRINPDKIAAYIEAKERYDEVDEEFSAKWIAWSLKHQKCEAEIEMCGCPPQPSGPEEPVLRGYKTSKEDGCHLWEVLVHPRCDDMREPMVIGGPIPPFWLPKEEDDDPTGNLTGGRGTPLEQDSASAEPHCSEPEEADLVGNEV